MLVSVDTPHAGGGRRSLHVLSWHWEGFTPVLLAWDKDAGEMVSMDLGALDFLVTTSRYCVGSFDGDDYFPCPSARRVSGPFAQCPTCAGPHIPDQQCTFEPKCDGSLCGARFCSREHAVYVAFHGWTAKVGMCGGHRVAERLVEQGADAYAIVAIAKNRQEARRIESALSKGLKMRQRVLSRESLARMAEPEPWDAVERDWSTLRERIGAVTGTVPGELTRLDGYPLPRPLVEVPRPRQSIGPHQGAVVGARGRHLVYENEGLNALDMSDLPARVVKIRG